MWRQSQPKVFVRTDTSLVTQVTCVGPWGRALCGAKNVGQEVTRALAIWIGHNRKLPYL